MRKRDDKNIECILKLEKVLTKSKVCTILVFPEYGLVEILTRVFCSLFVHNLGRGEGVGCLLDVWSGFHSYTPVSRPPYPRSLLSVNDPHITGPAPPIIIIIIINVIAVIVFVIAIVIIIVIIIVVVIIITFITTLC